MQQYLPSTTRERILDLIKEQHMTQKDLAERIGCARSTLGRFLSGETDKIGDENIIRIADVFRISSDYLLGLILLHGISVLSGKPPKRSMQTKSGSRA